MSNGVTVKRQTNIDLLRIAASFLVVLLHVSGGFWGWGDMYQQGWVGLTAYAVLPRCAVPVFLMISGKLFLDRSREIPVSKLITKYALRVAILYIIWGLLYAADAVGLQGLLSGNWQAVVDQFVTAPKYHLWYLYVQASTYLMLPVFWAIAKYEDGKYLGYICGLVFVFKVLYITVGFFVPAGNALMVLLSRFDSGLPINYGYFILGYYLSTRKWEKLKFWHCGLAFVATVVITAIYTVWSSRSTGAYDSKMFENTAATTYFAAVTLFMAFLKMPCVVSQRTGKIIAVVSRCTLFIYLIHPVVIERLEWLGIYATAFNPWLCVPMVAVLVFVVCMIPALVLTKIPVLNKWVV